MSHNFREEYTYTGQYAGGYARQHNGNNININLLAQEKSPGKQLLQSLSFTGMNVRRENVKDPAPRTLDWIFGGITPPKSDSSAEKPTFGASDHREVAEQPQWDNFAEWLREDDSIYWVCGKAGSGKSTLMAHIVEQQRTVDNLQHWSKGKQLIVLSHFFWRAGKDLQNNINGLLRNILHQICTDSPMATTAALSLVGESSRKWTDRRLREMIIRAIGAATENFCLFIDGLDEYIGETDSLLELLVKLEAPEMVEACVSSRPEAAFSATFSNFKQLRLEDLNRSDLMTFVTEKLRAYNIQDKDTLIRDVVRLAEGIFLWAALVTQSLVQGARNRDDPKTLIDRLKDKQGDLDALFSAIIERIDERYKEWLEIYVSLIQLQKQYGDSEWSSQFTSIAYITAAFHGGSMKSYHRFAEVCEDTKAAASFRSACLFEVTNRTERQTPQLRENWAAATCRFAMPELLGHGQARSMPNGWYPIDASLGREEIGPEVELPEVLTYEGKYLAWIHRSAYDFITSYHDSTWLKWEQRKSEIVEKMLTGMLRYLAIAPSWFEGCHPSEEDVHTSSHRLTSILEIACRAYLDHPTIILAFLDRLYGIVARMNPEEFDFCESLIVAYQHTSNTAVGAIEFWLQSFALIDCMPCAQKMFADYLTARFDVWARDSDEVYLISPRDCMVLMYLARPTSIESQTRRGSGSKLASLTNFTVAVLRRMQQSITAKRTKTQVRRTFLNGDVCVGILNNEELVDGLQSSSCSWPERTDSLRLSKSHAIATFILVAVFRNCNIGGRMPPGYEQIEEHLHKLIRIFKPAWSVHVECLGSPWQPRYLSVELSYLVWEALAQHACSEDYAEDALWQNPQVRIMCFPLTDEDAYADTWSPFWEVRDFSAQEHQKQEKTAILMRDLENKHTDPVEAFLESRKDATNLDSVEVDHRMAKIEIEPSPKTKNMLMQLLVSGSLDCDGTSKYGIKLESKQFPQLRDVLVLVRDDVRDNIQGLDELTQQSTLSCVEEEISNLNHGFCTRSRQQWMGNVLDDLTIHRPGQH